MNEHIKEIQETENEIKRLQAKLKELKSEGITYGLAQYTEQASGVYVKIKYIDDWMRKERNTSIIRCHCKEEAIFRLNTVVESVNGLLDMLKSNEETEPDG